MDRIAIYIDPGDDTGWSRWDLRELTACGLAHYPKDYPELPHIIGLPDEGLDLYIELPQDYGSNRQTDPNKLIVLGVKVGDILGAYRQIYHLLKKPLSYNLVWPQSWKGQVPKPIHHDRHLPKLTPREKMILQAALERCPKGQRHNIKDAVVFGLWGSKR